MPTTDDDCPPAPGSSRLMLTVWLVMIAIAALALLMSERLRFYDGPISARFDGREFTPFQLNARPALHRVAHWRLTRYPSTWPERVSLRRRAVPPLRYDGAGIQVTRIGHSTVLIQVAGMNLLTDPVLDEHIELFAGLHRIPAATAPGVEFRDLPPIDAVLISHDHADHLDYNSLKRLWRRDDPLMLVPLGVDRRLTKLQPEMRVIAFDWWQSQALLPDGTSTDLEAVFVPARHWSGRGLFDHNRTLWGGWVIKSPQGTVYFAGDTGYAPALAQDIAARFSPIRLALLPIGGYRPAALMDSQSLSPAQALALHFQLGAEQSIAMHYGRFPLTDEGFHEPVEELQTSRREAGLASDRFIILPSGRLFLVD